MKSELKIGLFITTLLIASIRQTTSLKCYNCSNCFNVQHAQEVECLPDHYCLTWFWWENLVQQECAVYRRCFKNAIADPCNMILPVPGLDRCAFKTCNTDLCNDEETDQSTCFKFTFDKGAYLAAYNREKYEIATPTTIDVAKGAYLAAYNREKYEIATPTTIDVAKVKCYECPRHDVHCYAVNESYLMEESQLLSKGGCLTMFAIVKDYLFEREKCIVVRRYHFYEIINPCKVESYIPVGEKLVSLSRCSFKGCSENGCNGEVITDETDCSENVKRWRLGTDMEDNGDDIGDDIYDIGDGKGDDIGDDIGVEHIDYHYNYNDEQSLAPTLILIFSLVLLSVGKIFV